MQLNAKWWGWGSLKKLNGLWPLWMVDPQFIHDLSIFAHGNGGYFTGFWTASLRRSLHAICWKIQNWNSNTHACIQLWRGKFEDKFLACKFQAHQYWASVIQLHVLLRVHGWFDLNRPIPYLKRSTIYLTCRFLSLPSRLAFVSH